MKIKEILFISIIPVILMIYGWYLGQLHQSGPDIAGILMFVTGIAGLVLSFIVRIFLRNYYWYNKWYSNILLGAVGTGICFGALILYARIHG